MAEIEVEKKFQPTEKQLRSLLNDSEFISKEQIRNTYYDSESFSLLKEGMRLRDRNGVFELKVRLSSGAELELKTEEEIIERLKIKTSLQEFIEQEKLVPYIDYMTERAKFKNGEFIIDIDEMGFDYNMCEIELILDNEDDAPEAKEKIKKFAQKYNFEIKKIPSKGDEYLKRFYPEKFKEVLRIKKEYKEKMKGGAFNEIKLK